MNAMSATRAVLALALVTATGATALAAGGNDARRPVASIAADLDITPQQFTTCFADVRPAAQGTRASGARERANKAVLLPCLQKANAAQFKGQKPYSARLNQTNRLLTGPFASAKEANAFIDSLKKAGLSGPYIWTSPAGEVVDELGK